MFLPYKYDELHNNGDGYVTARKTIIPFQYDDMNNGFSEGLLGVKRYGKWGFINTRNKVVIPFKYDSASSFYKGKAIVEKNGVQYYIDKKGKLYKYTED